jgi:CRISPR-associated protein Cmr5
VQGAGGGGMSLQTVEQKRAKHALKIVNEWKNMGDAQKELKTYVVGMPAMILMSGFGQTCAFYKSKKKNHETVLQALQSWLDKDDVIQAITASTAQEYQLMQAESLAYLNWLKKFARAYLQGDDDATSS